MTTESIMTETRANYEGMRKNMGYKNEIAYIFSSQTGRKTALVVIDNFNLFYNYSYREMNEVFSLTSDCDSVYYSPPLDVRVSRAVPKPLSDFYVYDFYFVLFLLVINCHFIVYTYISPEKTEKGDVFYILSKAFKHIGVELNNAHEKYEFYVFTNESYTFIKPKNGISTENPYYIKVCRNPIVDSNF
jgi:hypothetical protein